MKNFNHYQDLTFYTIEENLEIIYYCLNTPKKADTKSCYGMTALILLASTIDAIGTFYRKGDGNFQGLTIKTIKARDLGGVKSHFEYFYDKFLQGKCVKTVFLKEFYQYARCLGIHNGTLHPDVRVTMNKNDKGLVIEKKHSNTFIYLNELYSCVKAAYDLVKKASSTPLTLERVGPTTGGTTTNKSSCR